MILNSTGKRVLIALLTNVTTNQLKVVASYADFAAAATTPASQVATTNNTNEVEIVGAPAASVQRVVQSVSVFNNDTVAAIVRILYDDGGTTYQILSVPLFAGQTLSYTNGSGWRVIEPALLGAEASSFRANKGGTNQTGIVPDTDTKITFGTAAFNQGGHYSTANSRWSPLSGKVLVGATCLISGGLVDNQIVDTGIFKNGSAFVWNRSRNSGTGSMNSAVAVIDVAAPGDFYEVWFNAGGAGNKSVSGDTTFTNFWGTRL